MNVLKASLYYLAGRVYMEPEQCEKKGPRLLHISDTPSIFFPELRRLILRLKPDYIVHTGDLVDNIKLQLYPGSLWRYDRDVRYLLDIFDKSSAERVYITPGNHDAPELLSQIPGKHVVLPEGSAVTLAERKVVMAHYAQRLTALNPLPDEGLCLFGHDLNSHTQLTGGCLFLNGLSGINVVELDTLSVKSFDYPWGIDDARSKKGSIGL